MYLKAFPTVPQQFFLHGSMAKKILVPRFTKLYLIAIRQLPQSCDGSLKRMAMDFINASKLRLQDSEIHKIFLDSSLQESQALLSFLHHSTLHFF